MKTKYDRMEDQLYTLKNDLKEAEWALSIAQRKFNDAECDLYDAEEEVTKIEQKINDLNYLKQNP